ncbi:hypothetical protein LOD99_770 [Oopsacas minuta]|uniref:VWFA domain-containing protein n=1 Tax=Oopsacas minuta TaxID=111878 RepID=A0AAV7JZF3_9METZ|nr:hypothetical protein LOD99_770 [Oopsacas minuta]
MFKISLIVQLVTLLLLQGIGVYASPFSQFTTSTTSNCSTNEVNSCVDLVFLINLDSSLNVDLPQLLDLASKLPATGYNCNHRYGITVYGSTTPTTIAYISGTSYFGDVTQFNSVLSSYLSPGTASTGATTFESINSIVENYAFRDGVDREIVLIASELLSETTSSVINSYENILLTLLQNEITLSVITRGIEYFTSASRVTRLIGMNFHSNVGLGQFSYTTTCTSDPYQTTTTHYEIQTGYEMNYKSYVELAWNTNGSSYDLSYFDDSSTYCSSHASQVFYDGTIQVVCVPKGDSYSYSLESSNTYYTMWSDIQSEDVSNCVDMVILLDRTGSMNSYFDSIHNLSSQLPEAGNNCDNRYGLTLFHDVVEIVNLTSSFWGTPTQLSNAFGFARVGIDEDGYLGISRIIESYTFRSYVKKHIVLFTDEPRRIVDSSLTKSSTKSLLESNEITFSIVSETEDFYYDLSSTQIEYLDAVVQYSNDMIGFIGSSSLPINVDAYNPAYLTIHDNAQHEDYVELAWSTDGVAYNIDFYRSSFYYDRNSAIFNTLMFSYESMPREYYLTSISSSIVGVRNNAIHYSFACKTNSVDNTSISLILNGVWHTNNDSSEISITAEVWTTTPGEYNFICTANNSIMGSSWLGSFTIPDLSDSPFSIFAPNYVPENSGITCDSYDLTSCIDLVFIIDFDIISTYSSLSRISAFIGSLGQSNCVNRYGLTVFGSSNGVSIINITSSSQFGSASELQNALNTNLYSGLVLASSDAYAAIDVAIKNYQFRSDVQKKFVLITDRSQASDSNYIYENMLHYILLNDVILSVFTSADIYTTSLQDRLIGMSGSNRIGYGNYSYCSLSPDSISTVFNAQYTINNVNKHYEYVELAWTTGGASYDLSYFDSVQFCSGIIVEVFSFATLAETPCEFNGEIYSYSSKAEFSYYTEWNDIISRQNSSCVDMVFVVDRTGSMSSYYSAINNLANNLPTSGDSCQNQFGLVIFHDSVTMINVGTGQWGTPSELYAALLTFSTSGLDEDGLQAIDYVIDQYTFRNNVVKHIVLFGDEARSIIDSSITNETVFQKLNSSGIILSVVTDADSFYSLEPDLLLAGVLLSDTLIGFGSDDDDDQIDSYSPSTYNILDDDVHTNYVQLAWKTGGVAYDLSFFGTLNYIETSTAFNRLMFSYGANSNFSLPQEFNPVEIINIDVYTNTTTDNIEYKFICEANPSPDLSMRLLIDGELYINSASSISVIIPLSHLAVGKYYFVCVANNSQGIDSKIAEYNIVDQPIYPFLQFGPDFNPNSQDSCNTFVASECADLVFILSMTQLMSIEIDYIMNLSSSLSASTNNCNNRYGLTLYGLSTGSIVVNVSLNSIFGTAQELRTAIDQNEFIESIVGAGIQDGYMGIHDVIEQYKFRDGVMRRILLFTNEARQTTTSSSQYNYEDTLLLLLKNNISLSVVSNGAEYTTELSQERLIGIIYNNRIGFGLYNETDCTNPLELVQDAQYSVTDRDVYVSYNELGWSTGGAVLDINYFQSSTYCPELLLEAVTLAVFLDATCEGLTYTYENRTDDGSYIIWDDINPQSFSNCVDMIFIVDRSGSMDNYYPSIINLASNLPTNGESCVNRYGLTLFEGYSTVQYIGGGNTNLFGTPTELAAAFSFVQSGRDEDGLLAINDVIDNYSFRSDVQKHVVLFTDEVYSCLVFVHLPKHIH